MNKYYIYIFVFGILVGIIGTYFISTKPIIKNNQELQDKIVFLNQLIKDKNNIANKEDTIITYQPKAGNNDNDVELKENHTIKVGINDKQYELPTKVIENSKFEDGKLIIKKEQSTVIDITKASEEMADLKARQYSRIGKFDIGAIYNRKEHDLYGGVRYNAKAWDIGFYRNINEDDWLIGLHYKF